MDLIKDPENWIWWNQKVRPNEQTPDIRFDTLYSSSSAKTADDPFYHSNYLYDDAAFGHLSHLAKHEKIHSLKVDFKNEDEIEGPLGWI